MTMQIMYYLNEKVVLFLFKKYKSLSSAVCFCGISDFIVTV
jgi:hypothetical protein